MPPFTLPGCIEPLNFVSRAERKHTVYDDGKRRTVVTPPAGSGRDMFPCALHRPDLESRSTETNARLHLLTLREIAMLRFMNEVTDKPQWNLKVTDSVITDKWMLEAQQQPNFTERMAKNCIDELRWRAKEFETTGFVFVYNGDVVKSDSAVPKDLRARFQQAVQRLEVTASVSKDYHPNSNDQVWDLVHPSLFPLVYGTSRIRRDNVIGWNDCLDTIGTGEILAIPPDDEAVYVSDRETSYYYASRPRPPYSRKFQWLPCDVRLTASNDANPGGVACSIKSYINNLHPQKHCDLYAVLEEVMAAAVPLWNETLLANADKSRPPRIPYDYVEYDPDPKTLDGGDGVDDEMLSRARWNCLVHPEPLEFQAPEQDPSTEIKALPFVERFAESGLQVIVKLATIELTPEKPTYEGGVWHVEGQLNEHICATALYYYSCENITESRLGFRHMCDTEGVDYEHNDRTFLYPIFGFHDEAPGVQDVGSVLCKEGRLLTFPNTLQHRVLPFELVDKTKPGHRKMLALFLVDPNMHIISTSSVPPQRKDWWSEKIHADGGYGGLGRDTMDIVESMMEFPITMEQAKMLRSELMEERKVFEVQHGQLFEATKFSLCEH